MARTPALSEESRQASDEARLSMDHAKVQRLEQWVSAMPEIRSDKVEALQAALQDGSYQVGSARIAEAVFSQLMARSSRLP